MTQFNLSKIPFDEQIITIDIGSLTWDVEYVRLINNGKNVSYSDHFFITEFTKGEVTYKITQNKDKWNRKSYDFINARFHVTRIYSL